MKYFKQDHVLIPEHKPTYSKRRAVLKNWSVEPTGREGLRYRMNGFVYGHDSLSDGAFIETSPLLRLDIPARTAETLNTVYLLG